VISGVNLSTATGAAATAGTHTITASGGTASNYTVTHVDGTLTVGKAALTVTADDKAKTYGGADPALTYTPSGTLFYSDTFGVISGVNLSTATGAAATAGTHTITASGGTASNYTVTHVDGTLTVDPAIISLSGSRAYDTTTTFAASTFGSAGTIGGVNGETLALTGSGAVPTPVSGTHALNASGLALTNGTGQASNYTLAGGTHTGTIFPTVAVSFDFVGPAGGSWNSPGNWNQGALPLAGGTVNIPALSSPLLYTGGTTSLLTLNSASGLTLTGGALNLLGSGGAASNISGFPLTLAGGTLAGTGTVNIATSLDILAGGMLGGSLLVNGNVNNFAGVVSPGASAGRLTISGNYVQGPSGALFMEIGGTLAGTQYDQVVIGGNASLAGSLNVSFINGFVPTSGQLFELIKCSGVLSGAFSSTLFSPSIVPSLTYASSGFNLAAGVSSEPPLSPIIVEIYKSTSGTTATGEGGPAAGTNFATTGSYTGPLPTAGAYLETGTGQTLPLQPPPAGFGGLFTNVDTGESVFIGAGSSPPAGIYTSEDNRTVIVIENDGSVLVGSTSESGSVGKGSKVKKPANCS
jgi:hypothetical protein